ncbi:MAG: helicase, partial [Dehalococcoidia bacterium]|nr:helicase [Dehalococcoidia bacterium]
MRQLKKENPDEYERISNLRDGIRAMKPASVKGTYVFCQAGRYQQLFHVDENGEVVTRDIPRILGTIKCGPDLKGLPLPKGYNSAVMRIKRLFAEEVKHRQAERDYTPSLTQGQRYVLRELRILFNANDDEETKGQINILEAAFRGTLTRALAQELNRLRRNGITGQTLFKNLGDLYYQHNMREWVDKRGIQPDEQPVPVIICSEGLR